MSMEMGITSSFQDSVYPLTLLMSDARENCSDGMMEDWNNGIKEYWSDGVVE